MHADAQHPKLKPSFDRLSRVAFEKANAAFLADQIKEGYRLLSQAVNISNFQLESLGHAFGSEQALEKVTLTLSMKKQKLEQLEPTAQKQQHLALLLQLMTFSNQYYFRCCNECRLSDRL